jgi:hypothetical protein
VVVVMVLVGVVGRGPGEEGAQELGNPPPSSSCSSTAVAVAAAAAACVFGVCVGGGMIWGCGVGVSVRGLVDVGAWQALKRKYATCMYTRPSPYHSFRIDP